MIEDLIARVFAARNAAHLEHWRTTSYAEHMALGSFYEDVTYALDTLVEARMAYEGRPGEVQFLSDEPEDFAVYLAKQVEWIRSNRPKIAKGVPALENLVDALAEIYLRTIYKLTLN